MVEAKFGWLSLKSAEGTSERVDEVLRLAVDDAKRTRGKDTDLLCHGVAFLAVWQKADEKTDVDQRIRMVITRLQKSSAHAVAWCFPSEYRKVRNEKGNITPGVIMAASNIIYV